MHEHEVCYCTRADAQTYGNSPLDEPFGDNLSRKGRRDARSLARAEQWEGENERCSCGVE